MKIKTFLRLTELSTHMREFCLLTLNFQFAFCEMSQDAASAAMQFTLELPCYLIPIALKIGT